MIDNKCPKCNKKLSLFYLKPTCPYCNCNIMNYNMEKRLEEDNKKAEAEWQKAEKLLSKFTKIFKKKNKKEQNNETD